MVPKTRMSTASTKYHALTVAKGPSDQELAELEVELIRWGAEGEEGLSIDPSEEDEYPRKRLPAW